MRLGIVGGGVVGRATARAFIEHVDEVRVYDTVKERATHSLDQVLECDLVLISLPTPQKQNSLECDTDIIEDFCNMLGGSAPDGNYIIRSTVPIGFTKRMASEYELKKLCHSPEFLTSRCSLVDVQIPSRNIIGYSSGVVPQTGPPKNSIKALYQKRFPSVLLLEMTSDESEAIKLIQNSFFACKVAFFSLMKELTDHLGLGWGTIINGILADGRISPSHTQVPGPDGITGAGGHCLPKDSANLAFLFRTAGLPDNLLHRAVLDNLRLRGGK